MISGPAALKQLGLRAVPRTDHVLVLVPERRHRQGFGYVLLERTRAMPEPVIRQGLPMAPTARAVIDACRRTDDLDEVRAVVAEAVQTRRCTVDDLAGAVQVANRARTSLTRAVLTEISAGVRSVAEARAREVMLRRAVPMPEWNVELVDDDGSSWAVPDAWWDRLVAAQEIDSMEWHLGPAQYQRTQARQRAYAERGVLLHTVSPSLVLNAEDEYVRSTLAILRQASLRSFRPSVLVRRRRAG